MFTADMRLSIHSQNRLLQTSDNIGAFLEALGYQMDFEFVREGCALSLSSLFSLVCLHFLVDTHTHTSRFSFLHIITNLWKDSTPAFW